MNIVSQFLVRHRSVITFSYEKIQLIWKVTLNERETARHFYDVRWNFYITCYFYRNVLWIFCAFIRATRFRRTCYLCVRYYYKHYIHWIIPYYFRYRNLGKASQRDIKIRQVQLQNLGVPLLSFFFYNTYRIHLIILYLVTTNPFTLQQHLYLTSHPIEQLKFFILVLLNLSIA